MPNNFEIHSHNGRHWYSVHEPDSWALIIASAAVHDTPEAATRAAVSECINLARVAERHGHKMESPL